MGDLSTRIMQIRVFDIVGLDYAGPLPFYTKCAHKISVAKFRSYICLFTWTATNLIQKAVHLDLMSGYFTACFLSALHRLIYIKGCPSKVVCDNGPNFKGAARHLKQLFLLCRKKKCKISAVLRAMSDSYFFVISLILGVCWKQLKALNNENESLYLCTP